MGCSAQRHLSHFVEQDGAGIGHLEFSGLGHVRPGKGAADVAEKFAFQQVLGKRGTIHGHERPFAARALEVNEPRDEFLARAAFRFNQHVGAGARYLARLFKEARKGRRAAHKLSSGPIRVFCASRNARNGENAFRGVPQPVKGYRLHQIIAGAFLDGLHRLCHRAIRRQKDDRSFRSHFAHALHHLQAVAIRHAHVGHDQRARRRAKFCERFPRAARGGHVPAVAPETGLESGPHRRLIIHHQNCAGTHSISPAEGSVIENVVPSLGALCTRIVPPCCSITFLHTARPRPELPA